MTKTSIVQRLLDEKCITASEAVILLEKEYRSYPIYIHDNPTVYPWNPIIYTSSGTTATSNL